MAENSDIPQVFCDEFFAAGRVPVTTHEEWLLRLCATLMQREAAVVSVWERTQTTKTCHQRRGAKKSSRGTDACTEPCRETASSS